MPPADYDRWVPESGNPDGHSSRIINVMSSADDLANSDKRPRNTGGLRPWRPGESGNPSGRPRDQRATAVRALRKLGDVAAWVDLYRRAYAAKQYRCCTEILKYLSDKRDGKPGVADPAADKKSSVDLYADQRIQVAIRNLHVRPEQQDRTALTLSTAEPHAINNERDK
jgi:hypothetical protein